MATPPKLFSYVRFSSQQQLQGNSLERQNALIEKYTKENGLVLDEEYVDLGKTAYTGKNIKEGALGRFLELVRNKKIPSGSVLIMESLDRFSRMEPEEALPLFCEIINAGITVVTLRDGREHRKDADSGLKMSNLIMSVMALCLANQESEQKSFRGKKVWESKRSGIGKTFYSGKIPNWLEVVSDATGKRIVAVPEKAKLVKRMFALCLGGEHSESIARVFRQERQPLVAGGKNWTHSYVSQTLRNRSVTGEFTPNKMVGGKRVPAQAPIPDYYPALVSMEDFNRVQNIMNARSTGKVGGRVSAGGASLFKKKLFCGYCGAPVYQTFKGRYYKGEYRKVLLCRNAKDGTGCTYVGWEYPEFEEAFVKAVPELRQAIRSKFSAPDTTHALESVRAERESYEKQLKGLLDIAASGAENGKSKSAALFERIQTVESAQLQVEKKLQRLEQKMAAGVDGEGGFIRLEKEAKHLKAPASRKLVADLISQLFERIDLFPAGTKVSFARYCRMRSKLIKSQGKANGHVSARLREDFDRRAVRFFQVALSSPGFDGRLQFSSEGREFDSEGKPVTHFADGTVSDAAPSRTMQAVLSRVDDLPDDAAPKPIEPPTTFLRSEWEKFKRGKSKARQAKKGAR